MGWSILIGVFGVGTNMLRRMSVEMRIEILVWDGGQSTILLVRLIEEKKDMVCFWGLLFCGEMCTLCL